MHTSSSGPLGILGGTFDPIHYGHLRFAQEAHSALGLAKVRLIPAGQPPHRDPPVVTAQHRLAMARLAVAKNIAFEVDDAEVLADRPSYTVPTMERLRTELGSKRSLVLLLGIDAFLGLPTWHRWHDLFDLAHIAVATRPHYALNESDMGSELISACGDRTTRNLGELSRQPAGRIAHFAMTSLDISATAIRAELAYGHSPRFLLPDAVLDYIYDHRLYQQPKV